MRCLYTQNTGNTSTYHQLLLTALSYYSGRVHDDAYRFFVLLLRRVFNNATLRDKVI